MKQINLGASVSGHQVPIRIYQGSQQGTGQEHGAVGDVVCAEQFVDGQKQCFEQVAGMSVTAIRANARQRGKQAVISAQYALKIGENALWVSLYEFLRTNSCCGKGCAFPKQLTERSMPT